MISDDYFTLGVASLWTAAALAGSNKRWAPLGVVLSTTVAAVSAAKFHSEWTYECRQEIRRTGHRRLVFYQNYPGL